MQYRADSPYERSTTMYGAIQQHLASQLDEIRKAGLFKGERVLEHAAASRTSACRAGADVLNMCANNYLGLAESSRGRPGGP